MLETVQAMPIKFAMKTVQLKGYDIISILTFTQGHNGLKLDKFVTCTVVVLIYYRGTWWLNW